MKALYVVILKEAWFPPYPQDTFMFAESRSLRMFNPALMVRFEPLLTAEEVGQLLGGN